MGMSPGNQAITGGTVLRAPAIQSPDFVAGTSGWIIRQDGTAEFNTGTFRGSIEVGPLAGKHFIVNNPATGDVVDIYDSSNRLVLSIDNAGNLRTIVQPTLDTALLEGVTLAFFNQASMPDSNAAITALSSAASSSMTIDSGRGHTGASSTIFLLDSLDSADGHAYIQVAQKAVGGGPSLGGSLVQTDFLSTKNNAVHGDFYSATVAGGTVTFNHGCAFTPTGGVMGGIGNFSQYNWDNTFGTHGFNSTQARFVPYFPNGTSPGNGLTVTFHGWFWG